VKILLKKLLSLNLLFCFLTTVVHFHPHAHHYHEKISKKIINQQNEVDHHHLNECEKCLTKNNKSELQYLSETFINNSIILSKYKPRNFTKYSNYFNIYIRPPPSIAS